MNEHASAIVTVDLDSTLCDTGHRHRLIDRENGTDWNAYSLACSDDGLVIATATLIRLLATSHEIHYVSGRTVVAHYATWKWLCSHNLPVDGLWMDETPNGDHYATYGGHAQYKLARIREVEEATGLNVVLHVDDWAEVKVALEAAGIPCLCVRTPQEIAALVAEPGALA